MRQAIDLHRLERLETAGRIDPFALPVRFATNAHGKTLTIRLDRKRAILEGRLASGLPLMVDLPVSAYRGVAARLVPVGTEGAIRVSIELLHNDPLLTVPLAEANDPSDLAADWQAWGKVLSMPLLLVTPDGKVSDVQDAKGPAQPGARRGRRFLSQRRPRFLRRRKTGRRDRTDHIEGREIIARD